jgi:excisionase family DNA binding protein
MILRLSEPSEQSFHQDRTASRSAEYAFGLEEVAHILDCNPRDVRDLARRGKLRAKRLGRHWRFRYRDVMAYLRPVGLPPPS